MLRLLAGFVVAPIVATEIAVLGFMLEAGLFATNAIVHIDRADTAISLTLATLIFIAGPTMVLIAPYVLGMQSRGPILLRKLLALGAIVGNVPVLIILAIRLALLFTSSGGRQQESVGALGLIALGALAGAGGALAFWMVAVPGFPVVPPPVAGHDPVP
jgi:hypothetical protein